MNTKDRLLGMGRAISRRDFVHGAGAATAGFAASQLPLPPAQAMGDPAASQAAPFELNPDAPYPPALMGLRGNHDGSFDVAHKLGREGITAWGPVEQASDAPYDLVIVGAGISGLAAAHFYSQAHEDARILILDNHDDFGGHAKRNEFTVNGKKLIGYGGAQTLQEPSKYSRVTKRLLKDLGIDLKRFDTAYDQAFYGRNGLRPGLHFDAKEWGEAITVPFDLGMFGDYIPLGKSDITPEQAVDMMPIAPQAKTEFLRLLTLKDDQMPEIEEDDKWDHLYTISYRAFLEKHLGITHDDVFRVLQNLVGDNGVGIEAVPAFSALSYAGLPGWEAAGLPPPEPFENYIHHFPDGNASVARLIIRALIPQAAAATAPDDIVTAAFDYSKLDSDGAQVRMRLSSTVVNVSMDAARSSAAPVSVTYVKDGTASLVRAKDCILACNHSIIPYLCPQLPKTQREALAFPERTPILYNTVALTNWRAFKALGIGAVYAPSTYHLHWTLDFPVSMGGYAYPDDPDQPVLVHMERFAHVNNEGLSKREQARAGRYEILGTPFEEIERHIRSDLTSLLGPAGFDPAADIAAITVNRWAHGYAYSYNPLFDDMYDEWDDPRMPHMRAKKRFGNITIANSDSGASALFDSAVDEAYRAVEELG